MSGQTLHLYLRASPVLTLLTGALHLLAAGVLWANLPGFAGAAAAVLVCALGAVSIVQRTLLRAPGSPAVIGLRQDGSLSVRLRDGREWEGKPAERRYVTRWLVVLDLVRSPLSSRTVLIARDMLPAAQFRHLRLWALWQALPGEASVASA